MGKHDGFLAALPRVSIGQQVKITGEYAGEWPNPVFVVGIAYDTVRASWNFTVAEQCEIDAGHGATDGFAENDLLAV